MIKSFNKYNIVHNLRLNIFSSHYVLYSYYWTNNGFFLFTGKIANKITNDSYK